MVRVELDAQGIEPVRGRRERLGRGARDERLRRAQHLAGRGEHLKLGHCG